MTSSTLPRLSPISPELDGSDRPAFSVIAEHNGEQIEFGVCDFPAGSPHTMGTVRNFMTGGGTGLVPRNAAAVAVLDAYHAEADAGAVPSYEMSRLVAGVEFGRTNDALALFPGAADPEIRAQLFEQYGGARQLALANLSNESEHQTGVFVLYENGVEIARAEFGAVREVA